MKLNNKYFLLRHGQTIYQKEDRKMNYDPDSPYKLELTDEGKQMVRDSAEKLKKENIGIIFASPYLRTKQSAEAVAEVIEFDVSKINYDERIVDINLGKFMGHPMDESREFYFIGNEKFKNRPEGGESWNGILKRVESFLDEVEKKYENEIILVVSHADPIWLMAGYLRGLKTEEQFLEARKDRENSYPKLAQIIKI
jgi:broad specificity phosphatase PhoE